MSLKILITIDCEDFINNRSLVALHHILKLLLKHDITGVFFLTGHMAEKIKKYPRILNLLDTQEIGYHSTSHSIRPTIIEYTDIENYSTALKISLDRETRHINPITGKAEGVGGINILTKLFPNKEIVAFRAPGFAYSPPHLEALKEIGIRYDFSTNLSTEPISYKDITFYPYPQLIDDIKITSCLRLIKLKINRSVVVFDFHPNMFVNDYYWDANYFSGNPKMLDQTNAKNEQDIKSNFRKFELLLKRLKHIDKSGTLELTSQFEKGEIKKEFNYHRILNSYNESIKWVVKFFKYNPIFIINHFKDFYNIIDNNANYNHI